MNKLFRIGIFLPALLLAGGLLFNSRSASTVTTIGAPGNFDCNFDTGTIGKVQDTTIYLRDAGGITLASDDKSGSRTWITLPMKFNHGSGTVPKSDIPLSNGSFKVSMKVRLAGNKTVVWISKRNVVKLEVHADSVTGPIVAQGSLDRSNGSPGDYTVTTNFYSANQPHDTFKTYYIMIYFDKYDNNGSNDGHCGMEITVRSI